MTKEKLLELREELKSLPLWPWHRVETKTQNAVEPFNTITIYSGEEIKTIKELNPEKKYVQVVHYHGQNNAPTAVNLEKFKKNQLALRTIDFITKSPELISSLLDEIEKLMGEK